jgi:HlyD family secretion protein
VYFCNAPQQKRNKDLAMNKPFLLFFSLLTPLLLHACHPPSEEDSHSAKTTPPPVLTVSAYTVSARPLNNSLSLTGAIQAKELVTLQPGANGLRVSRILADEGDYVQKGQLLVMHDNRLLQAQLSSARNRLESSRYQYAKTRQPNRSQDISRLRAAVRQAEVTLNDAVRTERRTSELFSQNVVTRAELDARQTAMATAQQVLKQQQQVLNLALAGSRSEDVNMARLSIADSQSQLEQLRIQVEQSELRAPISGLIISREVNLGAISSFAAPYFTLVKNGQLEFRAQIPETDLNRVPIGAEVVIRSDANPSLKAQGVVRRLGATVDSASRLGTVRIDVMGGSGLKVGQFVRGEIRLKTGQTLAVPLKSVIHQNGSSQVFVLVDSRAKARTITTGAQSNNLIEVLSGLKPNEKIIEDGVGFIKDGDYVKIVSAPAQKTQAAPESKPHS